MPHTNRVRAERVGGGHTRGAWGAAKPGEIVMVPQGVIDRHPEHWRIVPAHDGDALDPDSLAALTVPELTALAQQLGVETPPRARKAVLVKLVSDAAPW